MLCYTKTMRACTRIIVTLTIALWTSAGCHRGERVPTGTRRVNDGDSGVSFLVPTDWIERTEAHARVFSGAEGTPEFFTTLTLQTTANDGRPLVDLLKLSYAPLAQRTKLTWVAVTATSVGRRPAVRFEVTYPLEEAARHQTGLLIDAGPKIVVLTYGANEELFSQGNGVFARVLATLMLSGVPYRVQTDEPT